MLPLKYLHVLLWLSSLLTAGTPTSRHSSLVVSRRGVRSKRKMVDSVYLWPNRTVPYTFMDPAPDHGAVMSGIRHWEQHTCLLFVHTANLTEPHIAFRRLEGCRSGVGREPPLGQNVSIGDTCTRLGIVVHEIGHAIGFYHEIRRPDRDDHVVINTDNILPKELFNFHKLHWIDTSLKYDLASVMHYTPMEWTANGRLSVATRDPLLQGVLGVWKGTTTRGLSHRDKLLANTAYSCLERWQTACGLTSDPCQGEGFLGAKCRCVCPPGTAGEFCEETTGDYYDDLRSPCSQEVNYDTVIRSPNYPYKYDRETWCVWVLRKDQCLAPVITILDFEFGPRDSRKHCTYDYLEIRTNSSSQGEVKCEKEVVPGTVFRGHGSTMTLFFNGELGGYRGFEARLQFENIPGCCRKIVNGTTTHWLSPGYPKDPAEPFECIVQHEQPEPALVEVSLEALDERVADLCPLRLCLPDARCSQYCLSELTEQQVVLPNAGSRHLLSGSKAVQLTMARKPSPCHKTVALEAGGVTSGSLEVVVSRNDQQGTVCEYRIQSPSGSHVQVTVTGTVIQGRRAFMAVDESSDGRYGRNSSRVYRSGQPLPAHFVSANNSLWLTLQGGLGTHLLLNYSLYECSDESPECPYWQLDGECLLNAAWMTGHCPRACRACNVSIQCSDRHPDCGFWAEHGQCEDNGRWMMVNCRRACGHCERCGDLNPSCPAWAALGECLRNPAYMRRHCARSCAFCDTSNGSLSTTTMEATEEAPSRELYQTSSNPTVPKPAVRRSSKRTEIEIDEVSHERSHINEVTFGMDEDNGFLQQTKQKGRMKRPDKDRMLQSGERRQASIKDKHNQLINRSLNTTPIPRKLSGRNRSREHESSRNEPSVLSNEIGQLAGQLAGDKMLTSEHEPGSDEMTTVAVSDAVTNTFTVTKVEVEQHKKNDSHTFPSVVNHLLYDNASNSMPTALRSDRASALEIPLAANLNSSNIIREVVSKKHPQHRNVLDELTTKLTSNGHFKKQDVRNTEKKTIISSTDETNLEEFESSSVDAPSLEPPSPAPPVASTDTTRHADNTSSSGLRKGSRMLLDRARWRAAWNRHGHAQRGTVDESSSLVATGHTHRKNHTDDSNSDNEISVEFSDGERQVNSSASHLENRVQDIAIGSYRPKHVTDFRVLEGLSKPAAGERIINPPTSNRTTDANRKHPRVKIAGFNTIGGSSHHNTDAEENIRHSEVAHSRPDASPYHRRLRIAGFVVPTKFEGDRTNRIEMPSNLNRLHSYDSQNYYKVERTNSESKPSFNDEKPNAITYDLDPIINELDTITNKVDTSANEHDTIINVAESMINEYELITNHKHSRFDMNNNPTDLTDIIQQSPTRISVSTSPAKILTEKLTSKMNSISSKFQHNRAQNNSLPFRARLRSERVNMHRVVNHPVTSHLSEGTDQNHPFNESMKKMPLLTKMHSQPDIRQSSRNVSSLNKASSYLDSSQLRGNETELNQPISKNQKKIIAYEISLDVLDSMKPSVLPDHPPVGSRRKTHTDAAKVQSLLVSYRNRAAVVDAFMMLPLCSELRMMNPSRGRKIAPGNYSTIKLQRRSHRRKMKMYKLLKRILKPKFRKNSNSTRNLHRHQNPYHIRNFNRKLRRTLRKLYRKRKEKLRKYLFQNRNSLPMPLRRRGRKKKLIRYIRKYRLNKIFQLFKIRLIPFQYSEIGSSAQKAVPILCVAARKGAAAEESGM